MNDKTPTALDRLLDQVPVGQAPVGDLLAAGHAAKRRQRRTLISGVAAATVLVIGGGTIATQALSDSNGQNNNPVADRSPGTVNDLKVRVESGVAKEVGVLTDDMSSAELAFWDTDSQSVIYVSDYAYSSSCPPTASADVAEDGAVTLNVRDYDYDGQEVCTADAGRVTVFIDGLTHPPSALTVKDKAETRTLPITEAASGKAVQFKEADLYGKAWRPLSRYVPTRYGLNGVGKINRSPNVGMVKFMPDGTWTGFDGCNGAGGTYKLTSNKLRMSGGAVTDIGCANMSPEEQLNGALLTVNPSATHLTATDANGNVVVEYAR